MTTRLLTGEGKIWPEITAAAKKASRADVAVAYFGQGGARRLPLKRGSRLVVDASDAVLKAGGTSPAELLKLHKKGVAIYHCAGLHAKVFVFPRRVFVGSTNVSTYSAKHLLEAVTESTDSKLISTARIFVEDVTQELRLGVAELESMQEKYRPPRSAARPHSKALTPRTRKPITRLAWFNYVELSEEFEDDAKRLLASARKQREFADATHEVVETSHDWDPPLKRSDTVIWVQKDHPKRWVSPPGRVIDVRKWSNGRKSHWIVYSEHPRRNRCAFDVMTASLGRGWKARLNKFGRLDAEVAGELKQWWDRRGQSR